VPIEIHKGIAGVQPNFSVNYASRGGDGILGLSFSLGGVEQISRRGSSIIDGEVYPVDFDNNDLFSLNGQALMLNLLHLTGHKVKDDFVKSPIRNEQGKKNVQQGVQAESR